MMLPGDSHVHSEWSYDARVGSMERSCTQALDVGLEAIAFTEHVDHTSIPIPSSMPPTSSSDWVATADGAVHVALAATAAQTRLVHVSSDALFSGNRACYDETHSPDPTTPYGAVKAAAETAVKGWHRPQ